MSSAWMISAVFLRIMNLSSLRLWQSRWSTFILARESTSASLFTNSPNPPNHLTNCSGSLAIFGSFSGSYYLFTFSILTMMRTSGARFLTLRAIFLRSITCCSLHFYSLKQWTSFATCISNPSAQEIKIRPEPFRAIMASHSFPLQIISGKWWLGYALPSYAKLWCPLLSCL